MKKHTTYTAVCPLYKKNYETKKNRKLKAQRYDFYLKHKKNIKININNITYIAVI